MTKWISSFLGGMLLPFAALKMLIANRGLKRYAILPLLVNTLFFAAALYICRWFIWDYLDTNFVWNFWGPIGGWLASISYVSVSLFQWIIFALTLLVCYMTFTNVGMILGFPLLDLLAQRVELIHFGPRDELPMMKNIMKRLTNGVYLDSFLLNMKWTIIVILSAIGSFLIPVIGQGIFFIVFAYSLAVIYFDIPAARNMLRNRHKKQVRQKRFWQLLGFGVSMELLLMIPFCGLLVLPLGVVAATMIYCKVDWATEVKVHGVAAEKNNEPNKLS